MNVFFVIIGFLVIGAGVVFHFLRESKLVLPIILGIALILVGSSFTVISDGTIGVRTTMGQISDTPVPAGLHFKIPFIQSIARVSVKQNDCTISNQIWGESSEKTPVYASETVVTYQLNADKVTWVYKNVANRIDRLITTELTSSAIKSAMVELITDDVTIRSKIEPLVTEKMQAAVNTKYGEGVISILNVTINQMDFEDSYNQAIAAKSIARQKQEQQAIENQTAVAKAEADKKVAIANAEAAAEASKISAQADADVAAIKAASDAEVIRITAEAEAEANAKIAASLTKEILESRFYEKWDGKLPTVMGEGTVITDVTQGE